MKLHIGSGEHYADMWLNVDIDPQWRTDLVADALELPCMFDANTFTHVYMGHFLEHIVYDEIPDVIGAILAVSTPSVRIAVVGPCYDLAKVYAPDLLYNIAERGDTGPGDHRWTATTALTCEALENSGLRVTGVPVSAITRPEWPNPSTAEWQCAFLATP